MIKSNIYIKAKPLRKYFEILSLSPSLLVHSPKYFIREPIPSECMVESLVVHVPILSFRKANLLFFEYLSNFIALDRICLKVLKFHRLTQPLEATLMSHDILQSKWFFAAFPKLRPVLHYGLLISDIALIDHDSAKYGRYGLSRAVNYLASISIVFGLVLGSNDIHYDFVSKVNAQLRVLVKALLKVEFELFKDWFETWGNESWDLEF